MSQRFIVDLTVSSTFNLPNFIGRYAFGAQEAGAYINESLPNITGSTYIREAHGSFQGLQNNTGCIDVADSGVIEYANGGADTTGNLPRKLKIDASRSSSIYKNNAKVHPDSLSVIYCIRY